MRPIITCTKRAFTLIELLTVIAIIGILAAILIPTVGRVRGSAHQAACMTNLRQIALGVLMFADENRGQLPGPRNAQGAFSGGLVRGVRNPAVNTVDFGSETSVNASSQLSSHIGKYLQTTRNDSLFRCPANSAGREASVAQNPVNEVTYLLNTNRGGENGIFPGSPFGSSNPPHPPLFLSQIRAAAFPSNPGTDARGNRWSEVTQLSRIWMITDADSINYGGFGGYPVDGAANAVPMPHNGGRNYAFFDGRVAYHRANDLPANP